MKIIGAISEIRKFSSEVRISGKTIGVVPTMGFLHEGHLSLIDIAKKNADVVIVTIFVNPSQFGPNEDFDKYPRDFEHDRKLCESRGVDAIFAPSVKEMYPDNLTSWVLEEKLSQNLCGKSRPNHFRGVTTIVAKLFNAVLPDTAVFGEKDYQQAQIIKRMTRDLNFPVRIITAPIVREKDGLAMSSRNKYLSPDERKRALSVSQSLKEAEDSIKNGESDPRKISESVKLRISQSGGRVDYVEILDAETLEPVNMIKGKTLIAVAAFFGTTRLIDNKVL